LLAVGGDGRTGRLEALDGVSNGILIERIQLWITMISARRNRPNQTIGLAMLPIGSVGIRINTLPARLLLDRPRPDALQPIPINSDGQSEIP
jgi:Co/Zn/Cd efflux system component